MRLLIVHNRYRQAGGEDRVFAEECAMLEAYGHEVNRYELHNDKVDDGHPLQLAVHTIWNASVHREMQKQLRALRPDLVHCHNTFPLASPAVYYAAHAERVPVVQTLHNYRLLCADAIFFRDGHVCQQCLTSPVPWRGVAHACYRQNRKASLAVAAMIGSHRLLHTWTRQVTVYIAPTAFSRHKFIEGGLPPGLIAVKPHFVHPDPGIGDGDGGYALYVGRLSHEKGIGTLLAAWRRLGATIPLKVVGQGPLASEVQTATAESSGIEWLGQREPSEVAALIGEATFLVCPSESYETFGRTIIEAFAAGTPVIAARLGAAAELVQHGLTGRHFTAGDADALAEQVTLLLAERDTLPELRWHARREFERKYTMERNYEMLMRIYDRARGRPQQIPPRLTPAHAIS